MCPRLRAPLRAALCFVMLCLACRSIDAAPPHPRAAPPRVDRQALAALHQRAEATESDAVVIYRDGELVAEWYFGKPQGRIEAMSATKSIVSLAIGRLIDTGKLRSLDQPVYELFPEWKQGRKKQITIRHLLSHTSGLQNEPNADLEIYSQPDFVNDGVIAQWRAGGVSEDFIGKLLPLKDRVFTDRGAYLAALEQALGGIAVWEANTWRKGLPAGRFLPSPTLGFYADGYLGQYLVVIPGSRIVAVRQRRHPGDLGKAADARLGFAEFRDLVRALVR